MEQARHAPAPYRGWSRVGGGARPAGGGSETAAFVAMGSRDSEELLRLTHLHLELLREQVEALPYPDGR